MRLSRRPPIWVWLALTLTIGLGLAGGYLAAARSSSPVPASNHDGHDMPGMDMGAGSDPTGHGTHGAATAPTASHPRATVLGAFAVVNGGVKLSTLASAIHPYPTLGEINKRVAGAWLSQKIFSEKIKKGLRFFFQLKGRACGMEEGGKKE